jgi:hypothetical protein
VRLENETVWLTQQHVAELFQTTQQNISLDLQNIYEEGELTREATHKEFLSVRQEAASSVQRRMDFHNLDAIISVGYSSKPNMGLTSWRGAKVRKEDVTIAKNYLNEPELAALNNLVEQYLVFAEGQAMRRVPMHMKDWVAKLHAFLTINDRNILTHAGKASHEMARELAGAEYEKYNRQRVHQADVAGGEFEKAIKKLPPPPRPREKGKGGKK